MARHVLLMPFILVLCLRSELFTRFRGLIDTPRIGFADAFLADFPSLALTNYSPRIVATVAGRCAPVVISCAPSSSGTYLVADHTYSTDRSESLVGVPTPELVCIPFFDRRTTVSCSVKAVNAVLSVERCDSGGVVPVECRIILRSQRSYLLINFWIDRVFLLGKDWRGKGDCQPHNGR